MKLFRPTLGFPETDGIEGGTLSLLRRTSLVRRVTERSLFPVRTLIRIQVGFSKEKDSETTHVGFWTTIQMDKQRLSHEFCLKGLRTKDRTHTAQEVKGIKTYGRIGEGCQRGKEFTIIETKLTNGGFLFTTHGRLVLWFFF